MDNLNDAAEKAVNKMLEDVAATVAPGQFTSKEGYSPAVIILQELQRVVNNRLSRERQSYNALQPINRLPPELLIMVYHTILDDVPSQKYYPQLSILLSVCCCWRSAVESSPSLWSLFTSDHQCATIPQCIAKSKDHPINVIWQVGNVIADQGFVDYIVPRLRRCKSLYLSYGQVASPNPFGTTLGQKAIRALRGASAPILDSLNLKGPSSRTNMDPGEPFVDLSVLNTPRLRHLAFESRFFFKSVAHGLRSLIDLVLRNMRSMTDHQSRSLLLLMSDLPSLEVLLFDGVTLANHGNEGFNELQRDLVLPKLQLVHLTDIDTEIAGYLMDKIRASDPFVFRWLRGVGLSRDEQFEQTKEALLQALVRAIGHFQPRTTVLVVELDAFQLVVALQHDGNEVLFDLTLGYSSSPADVLNWIQSVTKVSSNLFLLDLHFFDVELDFHDQDLLELLLSFQDMEGLCIAYNANVGYLLRRLSSPKSSSRHDSPSGEWDLPHLCELKLPKECDRDDLLNMVKGRYGRIGNAGGTPTPSPSVIGLETSDDGLVAELKDIAPELVIEDGWVPVDD